ncbi:hypothetical protein [Microbacterium sp. No. 7]|uniref:hypothetical protein n=1 Tax=Microbacterium sp. No. 7 TaxID=1714373 RepID=UPI0006D08D0B|nr:hypothetical protein [Microbacterium sp. No. 7]ALJ22070.1 hypothetical protein AOA12_20125 [Microbacterium sp. No. 7]
MSDRIDHAQEARGFLDLARQIPSNEDETNPAAALAIQEAQAHALLALVEQQRIANLIALTRVGQSDFIDSEEAGYLLVGDALYGALVTTVQTSPDDEHYEIRPEIREALGLS